MKTAASIILLMVAAVLSAAGFVHADTVRPAVWAGRFYPAAPGDLQKVLNDFADLAQATPIDIPPGKQLKALLLPHAGYIYSGWTAAHASRVLLPGSFDNVVVMAPDHRVGFANCVISRGDAYQTPLGRIRLHPDAAALRQRHEFFGANRLSDDTEHAVEVVLPVLQHFLGNFTLVPAVCGPSHTLRVAEAVAPVLNDRTLLVVSSDLSHYLPYDDAVTKDRRTIEAILNLDTDRLAGMENAACGKTPLTVLLHIARQRKWQPVLLHYANSGDTAGSRDRVVGYTAMAFYADPPMKSDVSSTPGLSPEQGRLLVQLARRVIQNRLSAFTDRRLEELLAQISQDRSLLQPAGTFVTLERNHQLRGCIGRLAPDLPILESVKRNAALAAFNDPRFPPLSVMELDDLSIEVSVLSPPRTLVYADGQDLISKLRAGVDGVIVQKGSAHATFLPQVWRQLPDAATFLGRLCLKAGLTSHAWQEERLDIMTYQVQYFHAQD